MRTIQHTTQRNIQHKSQFEIKAQKTTEIVTRIMNNTETNQQAEINQLEQEIDMHYEQIQTVALPDTNGKNTKDSTPSRESPKTSTNPWPSLTPTKNDQHDQPQNRKKTPIQTVSLVQARKPIYKSSVNSNIGYSQFLQKMNNILDTN